MGLGHVAPRPGPVGAQAQPPGLLTGRRAVRPVEEAVHDGALAVRPHQPGAQVYLEGILVGGI